MLHALEVPHDGQGNPLGDTLSSACRRRTMRCPTTSREDEGRTAVYSGKKYVEFRIANTPVTRSPARCRANDRAGWKSAPRTSPLK